jgi:S-methylmethionine-dependent homocysteine/selenocysteine methylase
MAYSALMKRLRAGDIVLMDGPTGTELQRRGVAMDPAAWCGPATLGNDAVLTQIHLDYIQAGSEVITANTFSASKLMLAGAGLEQRSAEIVERAVAAALRARDAAPHPERVVVAGSLSHMVPVASGSAAVDPAMTPPQSAIADAFSDLAGNLKRFGCDLLILEMMYNPARVPLALAAAQATGLPVWFGLSARADAAGNLLSFDQLETLPLSRIIDLIPLQGIDAAGVMHTPAPLISAVEHELRGKYRGPLMAYPDSGYFEMPDWKFVDVLAEDRFERYCLEWLGQGVQLLGGCCGLTPAHISAAARARRTYLEGCRP